MQKILILLLFSISFSYESYAKKCIDIQDYDDQLRLSFHMHYWYQSNSGVTNFLKASIEKMRSEINRDKSNSISFYYHQERNTRNQEPMDSSGYTIEQVVKDNNDILSEGSYIKPIGVFYEFLGEFNVKDYYGFLSRKLGNQKVFVVSNIFDEEITESELSNVFERIEKDFKIFSEECVTIITSSERTNHLKAKYQRLSKKHNFLHCHISSKSDAIKCLNNKFSEKEFTLQGGKCVNSSGKAGLNKFDTQNYLDNPKDLTCTDFSNANFDSEKYKIIKADKETDFSGSVFDNATLYSNIAGKFHHVSFKNVTLKGELSDSEFENSTILITKNSRGFFSNTTFNKNNFISGINNPNLSMFNVTFNDYSNENDFIIDRAVGVKFYRANLNSVWIKVGQESKISFLRSKVRNLHLGGAYFKEFLFDAVTKHNTIFIHTEGNYRLSRAHFDSVSVDEAVDLLGGKYDAKVILDYVTVSRMKISNSAAQVEMINSSQVINTRTSDNLYVLFDVNQSALVNLRSNNDTELNIDLSDGALISSIKGSSSKVSMNLVDSSIIKADLKKMSSDFDLNMNNSEILGGDFSGLICRDQSSKILKSTIIGLNLNQFSYEGEVHDSSFISNKGHFKLNGKQYNVEIN